MSERQPPAAPGRAYIKLLSNGDLAAYKTDIREEHRDGCPVYEYARVHQVDEGRVGERELLIKGLRGRQEIRTRLIASGASYDETIIMRDLDTALLLLPQLSSSAPPSTYHCSCGAACTAEEYIEHLLRGHDRGMCVSSSERGESVE